MCLNTLDPPTTALTFPYGYTITLMRFCSVVCHQLEAEQMMEQLIYWVRVDSSGLGRPQLPGDVPTNSMAVPMMLLCLVEQLTEGRGREVAQKYRERASWCVQQILQHIQVCLVIEMTP